MKKKTAKVRPRLTHNRINTIALQDNDDVERN